MFMYSLLRGCSSREFMAWWSMDKSVLQRFGGCIEPILVETLEEKVKSYLPDRTDTKGYSRS